ncbi:DUF4097 family beta strand repeat-containing protein [Gulosibacter molinativorax]|uniref:Adhesin domain-containing protein n=1 Tax=Gulosibacter molinativorax TaxID=256821 RepID=A0ABT7C809_9MICO|nr:hypothetical protein [Gulosibacter molinativorax]MDJ1371376.1 hypothetical protein [Gulosibacter molinativorax]QUY62873.1 Hypotetical protein [Gulosibacter molinativorax]
MAIEQWHVDTPKTIDLELVRHVRVNMMGGSVNVMTHDLPSTRVEVSSLTGRDMKIAIDGDNLIIDHPQLGWGSLGESARTLVDPPKATVSILVPKSVSVNVKATSADVLVTGIDGDISITTIGGEHFMDSTSGKLHLTSAGGELSVRGHAGAVEARTATGDVTVTGKITSFDGNTISGSTVIDLASEDASPASISNASVSGATTVRLPENTNASYQFATVATKVQVGELIVDPQYGKVARYEAPIPGEPITDIRLSTVAGRITVIGGLPVSTGASGAAAGAGEADAQAGSGAQADSSAQAGSNAQAPGRFATDLGNGGGAASGTAAGTGAGAGSAAGPSGAATADAADGGAAQATGTQATAAPASWAVPWNNNIDLENAPRVEGNVVPPAEGAAPATHGEPPAGTHTAAAAAGNTSNPRQPAGDSPVSPEDEKPESEEQR